MRSFLVALFMLIAAGPGFAIDPEEVLDDPVLEARARNLSQILRCLVCQNQSIDESNAGLAREIRKVVRERLLAGANDDEAIAYLVDRYGDYVLLKPPLQPSTYLLWFGPVLIGLATAGGLLLLYRRQRKAPALSPQASGLSPEESTRLDRLLEGDGS